MSSAKIITCGTHVAQKMCSLTLGLMLIIVDRQFLVSWMTTAQVVMFSQLTVF
jgi:hypothetical protein